MYSCYNKLENQITYLYLSFEAIIFFITNTESVKLFQFLIVLAKKKTKLRKYFLMSRVEGQTS